MCQGAGGGGVEVLSTSTGKKATTLQPHHNDDEHERTYIPAADDVFCRLVYEATVTWPWSRDGGSVVCWTPLSLPSIRVGFFFFLQTRTQPKRNERKITETSVGVF